ncbi:7-carboxy-7-deazaguanine synthase QueE [Fictibacillus sp. JL2B1089]|uniref:7-carboxy-7-deazaguanine synthase QueE n=1 Tax=Fictibacillus sp. JL2B1089 TaxID=3399565 RepID=UPI003A8A1049
MMFDLPSRDIWKHWKVPMVEIFETVEGEGLQAGYPTVFVRVFHCNLRCTWCDTTYSYAPAKPEFEATIEEIVNRVKSFRSQRICFTGGEPLIHREKSAALLLAMADLEHIVDIHIETNGAIDLQPFEQLRNSHHDLQKKMRFVMDYKLPASGEMDRMHMENFKELQHQDEIKFVVGSENDFEITKQVVSEHYRNGQISVSPVWESMPPRRLVELLLENPLPNAKLSLQLHKVIWHPEERGV